MLHNRHRPQYQEKHKLSDYDFIEKLRNHRNRVTHDTQTSTSISKNVTPYSQTNETPILWITNLGYSWKANLSIYQNDTLSCVNTTLSLTNNKSAGNIINESWLNLTELSYTQNTSIYLFADYACNVSTWTLFEPQYYFRQCAQNVDCCSEDIV